MQKCYIKTFLLHQLLGPYTGGEFVLHLVKGWHAEVRQSDSVPLRPLQFWAVLSWRISTVFHPSQAWCLWDLLPLSLLSHTCHNKAINRWITNWAILQKCLAMQTALVHKWIFIKEKGCSIPDASLGCRGPGSSYPASSQTSCGSEKNSPHPKRERMISHQYWPSSWGILEFLVTLSIYFSYRVEVSQT